MPPGSKASTATSTRPSHCSNATIDSQFAAGDVTHLAGTIATLTVLFDRLDRAETAATIYGATTHDPGNAVAVGLPTALEHLRAKLGEVVFNGYVAAGAAMDPGEAVRYVRAQIQTARRQLPTPP